MEATASILRMSRASHSLDTGVGSHEVRGGGKAEQPRSLSDALGRQVVPLARRQVGGAVVNAPGNTVGKQAGQCAVNGRGRLARDACQLG